MYLENFEHELERKLITQGFNDFLVPEKNEFVRFLADKYKLPYNEVTDALILQHHKDLKVQYLKNACESNIVKGFTSNVTGRVYRTDRDDQLNMIGQKDYLVENPDVETVDWKTEDEGYISHTRDSWLGVYLEAFSHKKEQLFKYDDLKRKSLISTTHAELVAIVW